ncbi:N-6 DNA methylase [Microaerobacter geothermalis]|uniref:restriction endonuclease subunit M n=1 Tax=Microaerobacter geothermalis TaxID=674972 RepID=UPI001F401762|nr:N-6 DNA methylase [Microaerobacter geothermalis]MCF6094508.1 N-6 DNA methylase [Microaerobacter geothermalis]
MSEELIQKRLTERGQKIGNYEYYNIGATNLNELKAHKIIPDRNYGSYALQKPDGLIVDRRNKNNIQVIAVIEFKKPSEFNSNKKKKEALEQCNTYCELLSAKFGIITDGNQYIWINPQIKTENATYKYIDDQDIERGYDYITDSNGNQIVNNFDFNTEDGIKSFLQLAESLISSLGNDNSQIRKLDISNPKVLAKQVWQSVWLATGDDPKKCLMTFIELFIFKYLSDLGVLNKNHLGVSIDFDSVYAAENYWLRYYRSNVREYIKKLFPESIIDGTTIINGLSLKDDHNQDELFFSILTNFRKFGDLKNIDPEFKSRLFEEFLKGTTGKKQLAQFFTPRNVIKAIVKMAKVEDLPDNSIINDPACGVGGFILETMIRRKQYNKNDFYFDNNKLISKIIYSGHDYDESTIVLAKANILIFLSELVRTTPNLTEEFALLFNNIFKSCNKSIVGSLEETNPEKYDLIMSNPPYVTKGLSLYRSYISKSSVLKNYYTISSQGKEGLFIEKMVRELKPNGTAFIIVPDGFLYRPADTELKRFIKNECIINGIISLPTKTFYTTDKKTYILSITKKSDKSLTQTEPVFTYIVSNIGETLDVNRLRTDLNDLDDMATQFNYFSTNKFGYTPLNGRCKIQPITMFEPENKWLIDEWWTREEKVVLGIEDESEEITNELLILKLEELKSNISDLEEKLSETFDAPANKLNYLTTTLGNESMFKFYTGQLGYTKKIYSTMDKGHDNGIPIYTATLNPVAYIDEVGREPYRPTEENPHISIGSDGDGSAGTNIVYHTEPYYINTSRIAFEILNEKIDPMYIFCYIQDIKKKYGFDYRFKCNLNNIKKVEIKIPLDEEGNFDLEKQKLFIENYNKIKELTDEIGERLFTEARKLEDNIQSHLFDFFKSAMNVK